MNFVTNPAPDVGELGERLVAQWLQAQNWDILHHRWRCRWGEIDLIAQLNPDTLSPLVAFVEVKTRSRGNWDADGRLAITASKQAKLRQTAQLFLAEHPDVANLPCRFDVALVNCQRLRRDAMQLSDSSADVGKGVTIAPIMLGQPVFVPGYRLILQDYIPSAFD